MGELDPELDEREISLEPTYYCGKCNIEMKKIETGAIIHKCGMCGNVYKE